MCSWCVDLPTTTFSLTDGKNGYVQSLDTSKETINLEKARNVGLDDLSRLISGSHGRYTLVRYPHNYEGDQYDSLGE